VFGSPVSKIPEPQYFERANLSIEVTCVLCPGILLMVDGRVSIPVPNPKVSKSGQSTNHRVPHLYMDRDGHQEISIKIDVVDTQRPPLTSAIAWRQRLGGWVGHAQDAAHPPTILRDCPAHSYRCKSLLLRSVL
jgi:hypothetical protein